jgi:hypothetical protein
MLEVIGSQGKKGNCQEKGGTNTPRRDQEKGGEEIIDNARH